jgi:hypothetical protein
MPRQKIFTKQYSNDLLIAASSQDNIYNYSQEKFAYDDIQTLDLVDFVKPDGLAERMLAADNDCDRAKELYKAFSSITPIQASYQPFWDYLSHVDLFQVVQKRWPDVAKAKKPSVYIKEHWFGRDIMQCLSGWWWTVAMTVGENNDFTLTDFIFDKREDLRQNLGTSTLFRHRDFTRALLQFLKDTPEIINEHQIPRCRFIIQHFNRLGSVKQLTYLNEADFKSLLEGLKPQILAVKSLSDLR